MMDWINKFDSVKEIGASTRFSTYKATVDGDKYFVKMVNENTDEWSIKSLEKEYRVYSQLSLDNFHTPSVYAYEPDEYISIDWIDGHEWLQQSFKHKNYVTKLINEYVLFLNDLQNHEPIHVEIRWPNTPEFFYRMDVEVNFNKNAFTTLDPTLRKAKSKVKQIHDTSEIETTLVHGDLFYPNIMFDDSGGIMTAIDWEIAGEFDPMYDAAFIESTQLDIVSRFSENYTRKSIEKEFRDSLELNQKERERMELYKLWPLYVNMAAIEQRSNVPDHSPFEDRKGLLNYLYKVFEHTAEKCNIATEKPLGILNL